jgi:hypothetical protein
MTQYTFKVNGENRTVEAFDLEEALRGAGIDESDDYEVVEGDDFKNKCFMAAITDDVLFGS